MAFGFGRRADKADETMHEQQQHAVDATNNQHHHSHIRGNLHSHTRSDAQTQPQVAQVAQVEQRQHLRIDDARVTGAQRQDRSATLTSNSHVYASDPRRRGGELSGSALEARMQGRTTRGMTTTSSTTSSATTTASAFLDEQLQLQAQQRRQRRGTTASSTYSSKSGASTESAERADTKVDVLFKGHLMVKRGLLKAHEKRFYFLVRGSPELYCCKDETSFNLWFASGWALNAVNAVAKGSGLTPVLVCSVLRADRAGDAGGSDRGIVLLAAASSAKSASLKFYAESAERCERWIRAFHKVQANRRSAAAVDDADSLATGPQSPSSTAASSSGGSNGPREPHHSHGHSNSNGSTNQDFVASPRHVLNHIRSRQASRSDASQGSSTATPRAYAGGLLRTKSREDSQSVKSSSSSEISDQRSDRPAGLFNSALSSNGSQGNVLLFVPAAGSAISLSDTKLALAKKQIQELLAQGAKRPTRGGMEQPSNQSQWRYGTPEYVLADLEYMKHKQREHESTPLESYVEECCQTFLMEATHRAHYSDWSSVRQEYFYLQVNDGDRIPGHAICESDLFGLLLVNDHEVTDVDSKEGEEKDPRAILSEAFTEGFPMEVLEVYTQPPQCYFSWRHWGPFSGRYKGIKGDGSRVEVRGFGQMQIDSNRMLNLRLFVKTKDLFDALNKVATALGQQQQRTQRARAATSAVPYFASPSVPLSSSSSASALANSSSGSSAAAVPPPPPPAPAAAAAATPVAAPAASPVVTKSKATLTADIMDELANFTIAAATKERAK